MMEGFHLPQSLCGGGVDNLTRLGGRKVIVGTAAEIAGKAVIVGNYYSACWLFTGGEADAAHIEIYAHVESGRTCPVVKVHAEKLEYRCGRTVARDAKARGVGGQLQQVTMLIGSVRFGGLRK